MYEHIEQELMTALACTSNPTQYNERYTPDEKKNIYLAPPWYPLQILSENKNFTSKAPPELLNIDTIEQADIIGSESNDLSLP